MVVIALENSIYMKNMLKIHCTLYVKQVQGSGCYKQAFHLHECPLGPMGQFFKVTE